MKRPNTIRDLLMKNGFDQMSAEMIVMGMRGYVLRHGRNWRRELNKGFLSAWYPCVTPEEGQYLQRFRNAPVGLELLPKITAPKLQAEQDYYHPYL